ncbi:MAG: peptidoglycan DD-metalloendopeptidase family protein [Chloroflexota bacterium]
MSTIPLRLFPEDLKVAASNLGNWSDQSRQVRDVLTHAWSRLDAGWEDYAETGIETYYHESVSEIDRMVAMLSQSSKALIAIAEAIETADQRNTSLFGDWMGTNADPTGMPEGGEGGGPEEGDPPQCPPGFPPIVWNYLPPAARVWVVAYYTKYASATMGLNLRESAGTAATVALTIPYGAAIIIRPDVPPVEADGHQWYQVTYTDEDGVHTGWVAGEFLSEEPVPEIETAATSTGGNALSIAPISGASITGWEHGDKEYKIPAGTVVGNNTYTEDTVISQENYDALPPADQARVIFDQQSGQYIIPAGTTFEGITYAQTTYIGEAEYLAILPAAQAAILYVGMHPGIDISGSDSSLEANADGTVYMYQAWKDDKGTWHYDQYDPADADANQANDDLGGFGNYLVLETTVNGETYYQVFAHLDSFDANLTQGQSVEAGTALGTMGSTGNSTGDHIHWEIRTDAGIDQGNNHGIAIWFPSTSADLDTYFVDPDTFAALLASQNEQQPAETTATP